MPKILRCSIHGGGVTRSDSAPPSLAVAQTLLLVCRCLFFFGAAAGVRFSGFVCVLLLFVCVFRFVCVCSVRRSRRFCSGVAFLVVCFDSCALDREWSALGFSVLDLVSVWRVCPSLCGGSSRDSVWVWPGGTSSVP
ncbi:hypothetical protein TSUD_359600 [Trifolium subterraneum]|uniref:Uncharacterized protein n=1 Tax=Trifolium subterraneum TaxID=3900 RepID=A0A2Z6N9U4_TRISU|nr:hypothetical protein TSUD_359600 [Trifolium subterraneum]